MKKFLITTYTNNNEDKKYEIEAENIKEAREIALEDNNIEVEEQEEPSCIKCGKIISIGESDDYGGMCATCWHERN